MDKTTKIGRGVSPPLRWPIGCVTYTAQKLVSKTFIPRTLKLAVFPHVEPVMIPQATYVLQCCHRRKNSRASNIDEIVRPTIPILAHHDASRPTQENNHGIIQGALDVLTMRTPTHPGP